MIETAQAFGVDIGGSGIKAAPVDLTKGDFAEPRLKILTPEVSTPQAVAKIVKQQLDHFEVPESAPVGIAFPAPIKPGPVSYTHLDVYKRQVLGSLVLTIVAGIVGSILDQ